MSSFHVSQQNFKLNGAISAPPSKSHTLRAVLFATLAQGTSKICNYLESPDLDAMVTACIQLGAKINRSVDCLIIEGVAGKPKLPDNIIDAGNSGQVLRFVAAIAALLDGYVVITGDHSIRYSRPVKPLMEGLRKLGATCISTKGDDFAPLIIKGPISAGYTSLDGQDSQPVSSLLITSIFLQGDTEIDVVNPGEKPWIALTLSWLKYLEVEYTNNNFTNFVVKGNNAIKSFDYTVAGDFSSIAYPVVAAIITNSTIRIDNLDINDAQGDKEVLNVLKQMGAKIICESDHIIVESNSTMVGMDINVNDFIDALPILAVMGCYAAGTTRLLNAKIARNKESDRIRTIAMELKKMGAVIEEISDGLLISRSNLQSAELESHHDHRIAMAVAVAALGAEGITIINNIDCVAKSYRDFHRDMAALGCNMVVA